MSESRILLVEDDHDWLGIYLNHLKGESYTCEVVDNVTEAIKLLENKSYDAVVTDLKMIGFGTEFGGFKILEKVKEIDNTIQIIVITAFGTQDIALQAMSQGAFDIVYKPPEPTRFKHIIQRAILAKQELSRYQPAKVEKIGIERVPGDGDKGPFVTQDGFLGFRGNSRSIQRTFKDISFALLNAAPVFIYGESGTGKSQAARAIHLNSNRKNKPFSHISYFDFVNKQNIVIKNLERLQGGTFVLDNLTPANMKDEETLGRLWENVKANNVRLIFVITTPTSDLDKLPDGIIPDFPLQRKLDATTVYISPLRQRKDSDDIPILAGYFVRNLSQEMYPGSVISVSSEALELLIAHEYKEGNVRELFEILKGAISLLGGSGEISREHLLLPVAPVVPPAPVEGAKGSEAPEPKFYSLVIGIDKYERLRNLTKAARDALDFYNLLGKGTISAYQAKLLLDVQATKTNILAELAYLSKQSTAQDRVIVFFSGHGAQISGKAKQEYLCPVDGDLANPDSTFISSLEFTEALRQIRSAQLLVVMDACHAGGVGEPKDSFSEIKAGLSDKSYDQMSQGQGRVILASCKPDEVSWELEEMPNGLFTHFLLDGLKGGAARKDGSVWLGNLFSFVSENVPKYKTQHPYLKSETQDLIIYYTDVPTSSETKTAASKFDLAVIRKFINEFFNDEEVTIFCQDYFHAVYNDFGTGMTKAMKIAKLLDYCQRNLQMDFLLAKLAQEKPKQISLLK